MGGAALTVKGRGSESQTGEAEADHRETYLFLGSSKHEPRREEQEDRWV